MYQNPAGGRSLTLPSESKDQPKSGRKIYNIAEPILGELEMSYVIDAMRSGWISSLGPYIGRFEDDFAASCQCKHGAATSNGTAALHLALVALGIGPGDEVIIPSLTFVATANAVIYTGATPVFVDSLPSTWCMDPAAIERAISPRTRGIIAVHLYGHPCEMDAVTKIASTRGIAVIEDAAQAHGAQYGNRRVGSLGDVGIFSFYGSKIITTGEGGMLVSNNPKLIERARFLRDHAMSADRPYWHPEVGYNYRMTNIQAAIGLAQIERIEEFLSRKRKLLNSYRQLLSGIDGLEFNPDVLPSRSSLWLVCILLPPGVPVADIAARLKEDGVDTRPFFHPMHELPPFKQFRAVHAEGDGCPVAERLARTGMVLPSSLNFIDEDIEFITSRFTHAFKAVKDSLCYSSA